MWQRRQRLLFILHILHTKWGKKIVLCYFFTILSKVEETERISNNRAVIYFLSLKRSFHLLLCFFFLSECRAFLTATSCMTFNTYQISWCVQGELKPNVGIWVYCMCGVNKELEDQHMFKFTTISSSISCFSISFRFGVFCSPSLCLIWPSKKWNEISFSFYFESGVRRNSSFYPKCCCSVFTLRYSNFC